MADAKKAAESKAPKAEKTAAKPKKAKTEAAAEPKSKFLTYKGKPLVRSGNILYYGSMSDKYVIMLTILSTKDCGELKIADQVLVQLMYTDPEIRSRDRIVKKSEKHGLYNAMDIGSIWLERALANG